MTELTQTLHAYRRESKAELDSPTIQSAMDSLSSAGGGKVVLTPGTYRCGTLFLRSNVTLHLEEGAIIVGSGNLADYPMPAEPFIDAIGDIRGCALLVAERATHLSLTGQGVVDGNGGAFPIGSPDHKQRPFLCRIAYCKKIQISGVTLRGSAAWTCHLLGCEEVVIEDIHIDSRINENNDGIDVDSCRHVTIRNSFIASDDDAICLKATLPEPCEDVRISGCTLITECSALKLGTESYGDIRRVTMLDCRIPYAGTGAIKLLSSDGGVFEDVEIRGIDIERATGPVFLRLGHRGRTYVHGAEAKGPGKLRRVRFANIRARTFVPPKDIVQPFTEEIMPSRAFSGVFLTGLPGHPIEEVTFENVTIEFSGGGQPEDAGRTLPEEPAMYPELFYFGALPAAGFYVRHARSIRFAKTTGSLQQPDPRPLFAYDDVEDVVEAES